MAWLPMYLLKSDVEFLNDWLNQEEEIAFLVANGFKRWIARKEHDILADIGTQFFDPDGKFRIPDSVEYHLWHIPSGPLPIPDDTGGSVKLRMNKEDWDGDWRYGK